MGSSVYSTLIPMLSSLVSLLIFVFVIRAVSRAAKNAGKGQRETEMEPRADYDTQSAAEESAASDIGFEIPKMRHAPRIERQTGVYQGGVYHETKPLGDIETPGRQHCAGSEKSSSIEEGRHSCAAAEAPSEYKGERPAFTPEENSNAAVSRGPAFTARDLRAVFVMTEVLGKPKALQRR